MPPARPGLRRRRYELLVLIREVRHHRSGLEQAYRLTSVERLVVYAARDLGVRIDLNETLVELHALPDIVNPSVIVNAELLQEDPCIRACQKDRCHCKVVIYANCEVIIVDRLPLCHSSCKEPYATALQLKSPTTLTPATHSET